MRNKIEDVFVKEMISRIAEKSDSKIYHLIIHHFIIIYNLYNYLILFPLLTRHFEYYRYDMLLRYIFNLKKNFGDLNIITVPSNIFVLRTVAIFRE